MGTIKREEVVSLLRRVMVDCPSFCAAPAVSIAKGKEIDGWELSVFWVPGALDGDCLEKIIAERGLEVVTLNGRTVFRSAKNQLQRDFEVVPAFLACVSIDLKHVIFE